MSNHDRLNQGNWWENGNMNKTVEPEVYDDSIRIHGAIKFSVFRECRERRQIVILRV